jgi:hypothetical protein
MNRRHFFRISSLGIGVVSLLPAIFFAAARVPSVSYKDFDWTIYRCCYVFRIEKDNNGNHEIVSRLLMTRKTKLKIKTPLNIDLAAEKQEVSLMQRPHGRWENIIDTSNYTCVVNTNELLLKECKELGLTHLYRIYSVQENGYNCYFVLGRSLPNWKRDSSGHLQIVNKIGV